MEAATNESESSKAQLISSPQFNQRALSLGRSRSRARSKPSELLARKQQILNHHQQMNQDSAFNHQQQQQHQQHWLSQQQQDLESLIANQELDQLSGDDSQWMLNADQLNNQTNTTTTTNTQNNNQFDLNHPHRRSLIRRAKQFEHQQQQARVANENTSNELRAKSVEAKLESLSEMLKSHQLMSSNNGASNNNTTNTNVNHHNNNNNNHHQHNSEKISSMSSSSAKSIDDVYILLAKKEKDLQLAAELGKVLLEKNDELSKANERITEDYSHKLELLEQDKHKLKRKLDLLDGEYENRLIELQTDCNILKNQLDEQQQLARQAEKEKSKLIDDLVQQNQRLTSELVEATKSEELLSSQLEQLNERFNVRMSNRQDHVVQLDALKEEIQIVNQRKQDLERRLKLAQNDKSNLSAALDESGDKILLLENLLNDKETKLSELLEETNELRDASSWLSNELESMISLNEKLAEQQHSLSTTNGAAAAAATGVNLQQNANHADDDDEDALFAGQRKRSRLVDQLRLLRQKHQSRMKANEFMLSTRRAATLAAQQHQQQRRRSRNVTRKQQQQHQHKNNKQSRQRDASLFEELESSNRSPVSTNEDDDDDDDDNDEDDDDDDDDVDDDENDEHQHLDKRDSALWRQECAVEIFVLLNRYQATLQQHKDNFQANQAASQQQQQSSLQSNNNNHQQQQQQQQQQHLYSPNSTDDSGISSDDIEKASSSAAPDERLLEAAKDPASWKRLLNSLKSLIEEMPCYTCQLMIGERAEYEQLQKLHARLSDELKRKNDELLALNVVKTEHETKLAALEEKCAILSDDLSNCDKPKEEIVKLAWKARDEAVERKNNAEICLAKTRIENMQISSQLMEVVQQKGELSQKLAQFEDDIHYMTQDSVKAKFTWEEYAENLRRSKATKAAANWTHQHLLTRHTDSTAATHTSNGNNNNNNNNSNNYASSNPLAQLLNFSSLVASSTQHQPSAALAKGESNTLKSVDRNGAHMTPATAAAATTTTTKQPSALDNLTAQPASLMRNFTSNRFNLKFWQRSSSEKTQTAASSAVQEPNSAQGDKGVASHLGTNNNHTTITSNNNNTDNNNITNLVDMETQKVS